MTPTASSDFGCRLGRVLARDPDGTILPVISLTADEMQRLPEYSATIPTGKTIGKRWRRRMTERSAWDRNGCGKTLWWVVCEYAHLSAEDQLKWPGDIAILYYLPSVDGSAPGQWQEKR